MPDKKQVMFDIERCICHVPDACRDCSKYKGVGGLRCMEELMADAYALLKEQEQEAKQYNSHDVACIIADLFGDPCACNFNDIDSWLPYKCDFRENWCPNPPGVGCWEQYLKHREEPVKCNESTNRKETDPPSR